MACLPYIFRIVGNYGRVVGIPKVCRTSMLAGPGPAPPWRRAMPCERLFQHPARIAPKRRSGSGRYRVIRLLHMTHCSMARDRGFAA